MFADCSVITLIICTNYTLSSQIQFSHLWILPPTKEDIWLLYCFDAVIQESTKYPWSLFYTILAFQIHNNPSPPEKEAFLRTVVHQHMSYCIMRLSYSSTFVHDVISSVKEMESIFVTRNFVVRLYIKIIKKKKKSGSMRVLDLFLNTPLMILLFKNFYLMTFISNRHFGFIAASFLCVGWSNLQPISMMYPAILS